MKKTVMIFALLIVTSLMTSAFTVKENNTKNAMLTEDLLPRECGEGYVEVSWSVDCPNGNNYSGSRCFRQEHALQAAQAIAGAPCPD
jgi:hypothetical protein